MLEVEAGLRSRKLVIPVALQDVNVEEVRDGLPRGSRNLERCNGRNAGSTRTSLET